VLLPPETFRRLCDARRLLAATGEDAPPIADIARHVGLSRFHFIRQFHGTFGATPQQWRTAARLDRAKQLLASGRSVTDVCFEVGFTSLGTFSGLFSRRVGESPSRFRRRFSGGGAAAALSPGCLSLMASRPAHRNCEEAPAGPGAAHSPEHGE
jgi:AraC-like DNA-binding protein